ncbi:hypothetical protein JTE90_014853 [Oedothorax gibbosus]|uniref:Uncharacterized protein n=1 Tax=Oedothorax gibbosus TaxID=931172 RepID=A0AAV6TZ92_9ARAC|nr:hypothetical protein JTE90_014853 [Oedothorax gibbosus]
MHSSGAKWISSGGDYLLQFDMQVNIFEFSRTVSASSNEKREEYYVKILKAYEDITELVSSMNDYFSF